MSANSRIGSFMRELRLPREERGAARAERRAEMRLRSERDNTETPERRAAAAEAERRRDGPGQHGTA
jgi:hypothetical protein